MMDLQHIKNRISLLLFFLIMVLFVSCTTYKKILIGGKGSYREAAYNSMLNYVMYEKDTLKKQYSNYLLDVESIDTNFYHIIIKPNINAFYMFSDTTEVIGHLPKRGFPTDVMIIGETIFMIRNSNEKVKERTVDVLNQLNLIDTITEGSDNHSVRPFIIDEKMEAVNYFICKSDISIMKKVKSSKVLTKEDYPKLDCPPAPY